MPTVTWDSLTPVERIELPQTQEDVQALAADIRAQGFSRCQHTLLPHFTFRSVLTFDMSGSIITPLTVMGSGYLLGAERLGRSCL